jgi:hypothetical protein
MTCFCSHFYTSHRAAQKATPPPDADTVGSMTPVTMKEFQSKVGVAYRYVERQEDGHNVPVRKAYMHTEISDRPFDVTVVNVQNLSSHRSTAERAADGTVSRASSFTDIHEAFVTSSGGVESNRENCSAGDTVAAVRMRYDPTVPVVQDAAYAATLNDQDGSLPHTAPYRASAHTSDPTELAYSVRARLSYPILGWNPNECNDGIRLTDANHCALRFQERGLYKTVRSVLSLRPNPDKRIYYEFFVFKQATGGGVCVGLSTKELPLNCLCGTRPNSLGFSTSGNLIRTIDGKESWSDFGDDLDSGCTIGCLTSLKSEPKTDANPKANLKSTVEFFVDGVSRGSVTYDFSGALDVYPTLSLFAKDARVYSLFSGQDMLFASCLPEDEEILTLSGERIVRDASNTPQSLGLASKVEN